MQKLKTYNLLFTLALVVLATCITVFNNRAAQASAAIPATPKTPKTITLFTNQSINQGQTLNSNFVTVTGYKQVATYISFVNANEMYVNGEFSIDGTNGYIQREPTYPDGNYSGFMDLNGGPVGQSSYWMTSIAEGPQFVVSVQNGSNPNYPPSATFSLTLYLIP